MRRMLCLVAMVALVWIPGGTTAAQDQTLTDEQRQAVMVLRSFLGAHIDGQPEIIRQYLGGALLEKRSGLLENPAYADFLKAAYANVDYEIQDCRYLTDGGIRVDVDFHSSDGESKRFHYTLNRNLSTSGSVPPFLVHAQTEIPR